MVIVVGIVQFTWMGGFLWGVGLFRASGDIQPLCAAFLYAFPRCAKGYPRPRLGPKGVIGPYIGTDRPLMADTKTAEGEAHR